MERKGGLTDLKRQAGASIIATAETYPFYTIKLQDFEFSYYGTSSSRAVSPA